MVRVVDNPGAWFVAGRQGPRAVVAISAALVVVAVVLVFRVEPIGVETQPPAAAGVAGSALRLPLPANASGVSASGATQIADQPVVTLSDAARHGSAAVMKAATGLVTVTGIQVAVAEGYAHASAGLVVVGRYRLGTVSATCHDGLATASRAGATVLARNIVVVYGTGTGTRAVGATVVITGVADRVVQVVTIATVSCVRGATAPP